MVAIVVKQNKAKNKPVNDNTDKVEMMRKQRVDMMARELAHTIEHQRFMTAWVKIGQFPNT